MKQSAAKTLGVAALGAAFAVAGAGAANAAPVDPDPTQALGAVTQELPVGNVAPGLPGAGEALAQVQPAVTTATGAADAAQLTGLLGGLPVAQGLPGTDAVTGGLPVSPDALPLQALPGGLPLG